MKKLILPFALVLLGLTAGTGTISAQRYEARVVGPRIVVDRGRDGRLAQDLARLNREVRQMRDEIRIVRPGRRIRIDFQRVAERTERLNDRFRHGIGQRSELRQRVNQLQAELFRIQRDLHFRGRR